MIDWHAQPAISSIRFVLNGDFDERSRRSLVTALSHAFTYGFVTIDLTGVRSMDAATLEILSSLARNRTEGHLRLAARGTCVALDLIKETSLSHLLKMLPAERSA